MNKFLTMMAAGLVGWSGIAAAQEGRVATAPESQSESAVKTESATPQKYLTRKQRERQRKLEAVAEERENATGRFKKKAIERAEAREKQMEDYLQEREDRASRFQKEAEAADEKKTTEIEQEEAAELKNASRFRRKAIAQAEERALKDKEKLERVQRRKKGRGQSL